MMRENKSVMKGFTLVEVVLVASIFSMFVVSLFGYYQKVLEVSKETTRYIHSGFLLEEGVEAMKLLRDESWSSRIAPLSTTTTYYLYWTGSMWSATTTLATIENTFTRTVTVTDVKRDASDNIATVGTYDGGTKKVRVSVSWIKKGKTIPTTELIETYITNLFNN